MRIGINFGAFSPPVTPAYLARATRAAEERGFHSVWMGEHVVLFDDHRPAYPYSDDGMFPFRGESGMVEPFTGLSWLAGQTEHIRLGTAVVLIPQRNPVYTAKEVANLDWLSGGRLDLGIGVGWLREEYDAVQVPWERRGARNDEYVEVMTRLWEDPVSNHDGEFWTLREARAYPKPAQQPHPPIYVGGDTDAALRRIVRLGAHWLPVAMSPDRLAARRADLATLLEPTGRSVSDVRITATADRDTVGPDHVGAFAEAGAEQMLLSLRLRETEDTVVDAVNRLADSYGLEGR